MGLFGFFKSQFIEVIEWTDSSTQYNGLPFSRSKQ